MEEQQTGFLPDVRQGVHREQGVRQKKKVLQPCLREPRKGIGKEGQDAPDGREIMRDRWHIARAEVNSSEDERRSDDGGESTPL